MKRFLIFALLLPILFLAVAEPVTAQAVWCYSFDFTTGTHGWQINFGQHIAGEGLSSDPADNTDNLDIEYPSLSGNFILSEMRFSFNTLWVGVARRIVVREYSAGPDLAVSIENGTSVTLTMSVNSPASLYANLDRWVGDTQYFDSIRLTSIWLSGTGTNPFPNNECAAPPTGELTRPLVEGDEDEWGLYDYDYIHTEDPSWNEIDSWMSPDKLVYAFSSQAQTQVLAPTAGTIKNITPLSFEMCSSFLPDCRVVVPKAIHGGNGMYVYDLAYSNVSVVEIDIGSDTSLFYIVSDAQNYVAIDQEIEENCILGLTISIMPVTFDLTTGDFGLPLLNPPGGKSVAFAFMVENGEVSRLLPLLTEYGSPNQACNAYPEFAACLNGNPEVRQPGTFWQFTGAVEYLGNIERGVILQAGAAIEQKILLDPTKSYGVVAVVQPFLGPADYHHDIAGRTMSLRLGQTLVNAIAITTTDWKQYKIPAAIHTADNPGNIYTLRVMNTGQGALFLSGVCVSEQPTELITETCYLQNPDFDTGDGWTLAGGASITNGVARMPNGASITQEVSLLPNIGDPPGDYVIAIGARILATGPATGATASLDYQWPSPPAQSLPLTINWNQPGQPGYPDEPENLADTITVTEATTANLVITANFSGSTDIVAIAIESVCIQPAGQVVDPPLIGFTCNVIAAPVDNNLGSWISYHWRQLERFFKCDLMVLLNRMLRVAQDVYKLMGWGIRYLIVYLQSFSSWSSSALFPWLSGNFRNMAVGQVTTINQTSSGPGLWDVLLALINGVFGPLVSAVNQIVGLLVSVIGQAASLLFTVLTAIITFIVMIVNQALSLLQLGQQLLGTLIMSFNTAAPQPIPGVPMCGADPKSSPFCVGLWVLDNTIFSGPGVAIIPLITAILSIHLVLWVVGELKGSVVELGRNA